jgi:hypothetical protein
MRLHAGEQGIREMHKGVVYDKRQVVDELGLQACRHCHMVEIARF